MNKWQEWLVSLKVGKNSCYRCRKNGQDKSGNNYHHYGDTLGGFCHACGMTQLSDDEKEKRGINQTDEEEFDIMGREFSTEIFEELKKVTSTDSKTFRGIKKEITTYFGVRHEFDTETGQVIKQFYPTTVNGELSGLKVRKVPKDFDSYGTTGKECDPFGWFRFKKSTGKYCLIAAGEIDCLSAFQLLKEYTDSKGQSEYGYVPCVSSTLGESSVSQLQEKYEWFNGFERCIICYDPDKAGEAAVEKLAKVLPRGKAYKMELTYGDTNKYLVDGKQKEWINLFFKAKKIMMTGVTGSSSLLDKMKEYVSVARITLPKFLHKLEEKLRGGFPIGYIVNIMAACVDADTEFFDGTGWKKISEYKDGDLVGQYNKDGTMSLVKPTKYIKHPCSKMTRVFTKRGFDQVCSDEHRFVFWQPHKFKQTDAMKEVAFREFVKEHQNKKCGFSRGYVKTTFDFGGSGVDFSEGELRLQVAVIADGRVVKEGKDNYTQMRFAKKRKYERLLQLCEEFGLKYDDRGSKPNTKYKGGVEYEVIVWPKTADKFFNKNYYQCSDEQFAIIADEVLYWDGCVSTNSYSTTVKENADFIQFVFASQGKRASVFEDKRSEKYTDSCYTVTVTGNNFVGAVAGGSGKGATVEEYQTRDGYKYCFEVQSSYLVLRRNGNIFVTGNSGAGKSTYIDAMILHWIMNTGYKVGVVSLEASEGEYGVNIGSAFIESKINLGITVEERLASITNNEEALQTLFTDENGNDRFYIVDPDIDTMKQKIEYLVVALGCKIIVIDPIQDIFDAMPDDQQATFMKWEKDLVKREQVTICNISHSRKSQGGQKAGSKGADLSEEDMMGHSSIYKSGGINLIVSRNKEDEDEFERNVSRLKVTKARGIGFTGFAGEYYYENSTHRIWDKDDYLAEHPRGF